MRLRNKIIAAALGAGTLVGGFATASAVPALADTNVHFLTVSGSTYITDDETFSDEHCTRDITGSVTAQLPFITGGRISDTNNKCGGEIRVEFHSDVTLREDKSWCVKGVAKLFEGVSESTNDLDGTRNYGTKCAAAGKSVSFTDTVNNTDEGGDKASFTITFKASL